MHFLILIDLLRNFQALFDNSAIFTTVKNGIARTCGPCALWHPFARSLRLTLQTGSQILRKTGATLTALSVMGRCVKCVTSSCHVRALPLLLRALADLISTFRMACQNRFPFFLDFSLCLETLRTTLHSGSRNNICRVSAHSNHSLNVITVKCTVRMHRRFFALMGAMKCGKMLSLS